MFYPPPYDRKKLVLLGLLWASVTSTTKGKADEAGRADVSSALQRFKVFV